MLNCMLYVYIASYWSDYMLICIHMCMINHHHHHQGYMNYSQIDIYNVPDPKYYFCLYVYTPSQSSPRGFSLNSSQIEIYVKLGFVFLPSKSSSYSQDFLKQSIALSQFCLL